MPVLFAALALVGLATAPTPADTGSVTAPSSASAPAAAPGPRLLTRFDASAAWAATTMAVDTPPPTRRPRAITHSDAYYTRLTIHRIGSYAILPLFAGEWLVGQKVYNQEPQRTSMRVAHGVLGAGIFGIFGLNTVTGVWNLVEARHDPGAARRDTHVILMLLADAGFAATWATVPHGERLGGFRTGPTQSAMNRHRNIAIGSIAAGTLGTALMWFWK